VWEGVVGLVVSVAFNGRYAGGESKLDTVGYTGDLTIMAVESNLPDRVAGSAVIENLVIDGNTDGGGSSFGVGTTGILLQNVYNCLIRNVTIMNCEVGIKVKLTDGFWSHGNRFEHIRMINVKNGIVFEGTSSARDFSYTVIDDVRISLAGFLDDVVGIKIGVNADLHCAFIKATVWLGDFPDDNYPQVGLVVDGSLRYSLVNLEVEQEQPRDPTGYGVRVNSGATVSDNQTFLLTALWLYKKINNVVVDRRLSVVGGAVCGIGEVTVVPLEDS